MQSVWPELAVMAAMSSYFTWWWSQRRKPSADVLSIIQTMIDNAERELAVKPDAASVVFFARRPSLCSKLWYLLGEGGGANAIGRDLPPEADEKARSLLDLVYNKDMREGYPAAHAVIQYTAFLTLPRVQGHLLVEHPNPDFREAEG